MPVIYLAGNHEYYEGEFDAVQAVLKEAAARTGLTVPVLRAWERRYGVVAPMRTAGGYRIYDEAALLRLRSMRRLVDDGWSPSAAAAAINAGTDPPAGI